MCDDRTVLFDNLTSFLIRVILVKISLLVHDRCLVK